MNKRAAGKSRGKGLDMGKGAEGVSVIGGADGPTSIFIAGKGGGVKLSARIGNFFRKIRRNRVKAGIAANPHTLEEVVDLLKRKYGAVEVSQKSRSYQEQKESLKASLVMRHRPDLLGGLVDLEPPEREDAEAIRAFLGRIQEREKRAARVADDIFPMDFHIYEIAWPGDGWMEVGVETVWGVLDGSCSGSKRAMRRLKRLYKRIYLYYGVSEEDIKNETERYKMLLAVLCS